MWLSVGIPVLLLANACGQDRATDGNQSTDETDDEQGREREQDQVGGGSRDEIHPGFKLPERQWGDDHFGALDCCLTLTC